jgi:membrane protease YdiL (CAAX protease family)
LIPTYTLLGAAILALWLGGETSPAWRRFVWVVPFFGAVLAGFATGILRPTAVIWITALAAALSQLCRVSSAPWQRSTAAITIVFLSGLLMGHQLPGFDNPVAISTTTFGSDAIPFRLWLNFDKTTVGLFLLGFCHARMTRAAEWRAMIARVWPVTACLLGLLLLLSVVSGYVRFDPKFPREAWVWMAVNLCFTCVAEEAFFRGFVQRGLQQLWSPLRHGAWLALGIAAILFGIAHAGGGIAYVILATIAGVGYGWAYLRTGRIEASILTHFALNATHFFLFTYPALQRAA